MTVRVYRSSDAGAPTLSGVTGTMVNVLDACLVNGYGSQAAAGWTKPFSATNFGVYRAASGTQYYLMVDDTSTFTTADTCLLRGYETMTTATDAGTNPFPNTTQSTDGQTVYKSSTINATARPWMIIAHEKAFYFFGASSQLASTGLNAVAGTSVLVLDTFFFGEIKSFKSTTDTYNCFLYTFMYPTVNPGSGTESTWGSLAFAHFMARNYNGAKISHPWQAQQTGAVNSATKIGPDSQNYYTCPEPGTGDLALVAIEAVEHSELSTNPVQWLVRGRLPGQYTTLSNPYGIINSAIEKQGFIIDGTGAYAGRQFIMMYHAWQSGQPVSMMVIELTDNWYA